MLGHLVREVKAGIWKAFLVAAMLISTGGCSAGADRAAAEQGVALFRAMVEAGDYAEIYVGAANEFRQVGPQDAALNLFHTLRDRLGPVRQSQQQGWRVDLGSGGTVVSLSYDTQFARGRGTELFLFRIADGNAQLMGYHVNSPALLAQPSAAPRSSLAPAETKSLTR